MSVVTARAATAILAGDGRSYEEMAMDPDEIMVLAGVLNLRRHLAAWVTTVRDNGGRNRVAFMIREGLQRKRDTEGLTPTEETRLEAAEARLNTRLSHFGQMLDAGLLPRMIAGSDSGPGHLAFGHLDYDLQLMVRGGMTPAQVLESATRVTAKAIGFEDQLGTLTPGKLADLIVVEGDPSRDITALSRVHAVFQSGRRVA